MRTPGGSHPGWVPWFFVSPFLVIFLLFIAYPLAQSIVLSLQQTYGPRSSEFVGLANFQYLLSDPLFWKAMRNTVVFAAGSLFIQLPVALALALLLNRPGIRGRIALRAIFFAPSLVGLAFVALLFAPILEKNTGLLNVTLHALIGFDIEFSWLEQYVMTALIIVALWMYAGFNMVYFLAALQNVDRSLEEAARLDGAGAWSRFLNVTIPAIRPVGSFVVLLSLIGSFQLFELPYLMLNRTGGPDNRGLTVVMYLYQAGFESGDLGYASAIGWLLALVLIAFSIGYRMLSRRMEA